MRPTARRLIGLAAAAMALLAVAAAVYAWQPAIAPVAPQPPAQFDAAQVRLGARLAAVGGCANCHSRDGSPPFSGGIPVRTPFGTLYGSNVTPDPTHGIGAWSLAAFTRAMRSGVARDGSHLYPAFPYDHYAQLADADIAALYAYLMTRDPAPVAAPAHDLLAPFGWRPLLAGWKLLALDRHPQRADPGLPPDLRRGAYLVQALGHCGACHTPRNALQAEVRSRPLAGGVADGWYAPPLDASAPSPLPWRADEMAEYLRGGLTPRHAIAGGPMQPVVALLAQADAADVDAIARYVVHAMGAAAPERSRRADDSVARASLRTLPADARHAAGAQVYVTACAPCHDLGRQASSGSGLKLPLAVAVHDADPASLLRIVRQGIVPPAGEAGRWMPAFGSSLTDAQLEALAAYLRVAAAGAPPWPRLAQAVAESAR